MKRIGVITSGGDSPGMNAAIRAVVRTAIGRGVGVIGFYRGWKGVIEAELLHMDSKSVGGIVTKGGTILHTARCDEFRTEKGRLKALEVLKENGVEGLVVIGGDGSLTGARVFHEEHHFPVMGVPGSIDNDISGTDLSIGFDTAVNTALAAIDRIRDTAYSHDRVFVIEVMGRHNGFIAVESALGGGAEAVIIPELPYNLPDICDNLGSMRQKGKRSSVIVVAEGAARGQEVAEFIETQTGFETRYSILGHVQRGGSPTASDRVLALRLGSAATHKLLQGTSGEMVGVAGTRVISTPLSTVLSTERVIDSERLLLLDVMAK